MAYFGGIFFANMGLGVVRIIFHKILQIQGSVAFLVRKGSLGKAIWKGAKGIAHKVDKENCRMSRHKGKCRVLDGPIRAN